jgi:hypothetical protein
MKFYDPHSTLRRKLIIGFTLIELLASVGIGASLLAGVIILYFNGIRSFVAMANYQNLDAKSCNTLDVLSREIRNSTVLLGSVTNQSLTLSNASARNGLGQINIITFDPTARTLVLKRTGQSNLTNLTECDSWSFKLYIRKPDTNSFSTNIVFFAATTAADCKLINMSWKCSRTVLGTKLNTESVQTAQIVLRNKIK